MKASSARLGSSPSFTEAENGRPPKWLAHLISQILPCSIYHRSRDFLMAYTHSERPATPYKDQKALMNPFVVPIVKLRHFISNGLALQIKSKKFAE